MDAGYAIDIEQTRDATMPTLVVIEMGIVARESSTPYPCGGQQAKGGSWRLEDGNFSRGSVPLELRLFFRDSGFGIRDWERPRPRSERVAGRSARSGSTRI